MEFRDHIHPKLPSSLYCIYIYIYIHVDTYIYIYICICIYICIYLYLYFYSHLYHSIFYHITSYHSILRYIILYYITSYIYICFPPLKDPRDLALFGRNPLNHDSRVLVLFGKNPLKYDSIPLHSTALPGNPGYPHQLQYHVYAVCVNPYVCLYAYGTRVMDTKHKLSEGGIYEYKRARLQRQRQWCLDIG